MAFYKCDHCGDALSCILDTGLMDAEPGKCPYGTVRAPGVWAMRWKQIRKPTGIKDKNGTEISQGDIVKFDNYGKTKIYEIIWDRYRWNGKGFYCPQYEFYNDMFSQGTKNIEIIGDIYQNAGLLKGE